MKTEYIVLNQERNGQIQNTLHLLEALEAHDVAFESHIYSNGSHGTSICDSSINDPAQFCSRVPHWVDDSLEWYAGDPLAGRMES